MNRKPQPLLETHFSRITQPFQTFVDRASLPSRCFALRFGPGSFPADLPAETSLTWLRMRRHPDTKHTTTLLESRRMIPANMCFTDT